jgi:AcrR family transcriptional regulator
VPRPKGSRDADHEAKRRELLRRMSIRMMRREVVRPSLRDLAAAAEVSVPTLRHYFGGRPLVVDAILAECLRLGRQGLDAQRQSDQPFAQSIRDYALALVRALQAPRDVRLGDVFAVSLAEGLLDAQVSRSALEHIVEPTLEVLETRLRHHIERGEMVEADVRAAGLMLLSPLLIACLHQEQMNGAALRPLALEELAVTLGEAFVRAYAAPAASEERPATIRPLGVSSEA